ncbi:MAG TPA: YkvA family protein [Bacillales bacterium]
MSRTQRINRTFKSMLKIARKMKDDDRETNKLVTDAERKLDKHKNDKGIKRIMAETKGLIRLVKNYANGTYREISGKSIVKILAGLLYFVSPIDAVPDFILGLGLIDDAVVIGFIVDNLRKEVDRYLEWEERHSPVE